MSKGIRKELGPRTTLPTPRSAWLLFADDGVELDRDEMRAWNARPPDEAEIWTCSPHVELGDTLLFYWMAPRKSIRIVGRAVADPFWSDTIKVNSVGVVSPHQWWVPIGGLVEVAPITYSDLRDAAGTQIVLKGGSGKFIRPEVANRLLETAKVEFALPSWAEQLALERVAGRPGLPDPAKMSLVALRDTPAGLLRLEAEVELYVVEPLLRLSGLAEPAYTIRRQHHIHGRTADYVVFCGSNPACVIEVKKRARLGRERDWAESPDRDQAARYARDFHPPIPFFVIDVADVFGFAVGSVTPTLHVRRREICDDDLVAIRRLIDGAGAPAPGAGSEG